MFDLSSRLDEVINAAKATVREIEALEIPLKNSTLREMAMTLAEGTRCLANSIYSLKDNLDEAAIQAALARKSENRFARIYRTAMRELFADDDIKAVLKTREVYRCMVVASERIDVVGEKLSLIVVKIR